MSLSGLRDISIIETPPEGRRPIRTTSGSTTRSSISVALEREHARGAVVLPPQPVETIDEAAEKLRQLCPELRFLVRTGR
jgi:transcription-repair coupling factor (superfamily II helicase)